MPRKRSEVEVSEVADAEVSAPAAPTVKRTKVAPGVPVVMRVEISGSRDGVPWPAIGDGMVLPADEAAAYLVVGYVELDK